MLSCAYYTRESVSETPLLRPNSIVEPILFGDVQMLVLTVGYRVDRITEKHWWAERIDAWSADGFNVESFRNTLENEPSLSSEMLLHFETLISRNKALRQRIINSPISQDRKSSWLEKLDDASRTNSLIGEWESLVSIERPWEPFAHRAKEAWENSGKDSALNRLVQRLEALDPSSIPATQPLLILIEDPGAEDPISNMIAVIELEEGKRRKVIEEMIELLTEEGVDATDANEMGITDALEFLANKQQLADSRRSNRLRIEHDIKPFDERLAERMLQKDDDDLDSQITAIIDNLRERLDTLNQTIQDWRERGIIFNEKGKIRADDLLDWEANLPEIEKAVSIHIRALERWGEFKTLWPDRCTDFELAGSLEHTEEFLDLVDSLDHEWRELELRSMEIVGSWEDEGFAMDYWRQRIAEEPRSALDWLNSETQRYTKANELVQKLLALDASLGGEDDVIQRVAILREYEIDDPLLEEMDEWINANAIRSARHRMMLETSWMDLLRKGLVDDYATAQLSLAEFERLIADSRINRGSRGVPVDRLQGRMRKELDSWQRQGFSIEVMQDMLEEDPMSLALRISSIREAVAGHGRLRRRLSALEWGRNPELSIAINLDLARPDRLDALSSSIPQLINELSMLEVEDEDFKFVPWRPQMRIRPILVPAPQTTVDDAMEAILEDMEKEEEAIVITPEEEIEDRFDEAFEISTSVEDEILELEDEIVQDTEAKIVEEINEKVSSTKEINLDALSNLLHLLGLEKEAFELEEGGSDALDNTRRTLASHVGNAPKDMRLDRLLRLTLRLMPKDDDDDSKRMDLIEILGALTKILSSWTRNRLDARHSGGKGLLLEDALILGKALSRIPGPGIALPLDVDEYPLPAFEDIEGLAKEVDVLKRRITLPNAGGVR